MWKQSGMAGLSGPVKIECMYEEIGEPRDHFFPSEYVYDSGEPTEPRPPARSPPSVT